MKIVIKKETKLIVIDGIMANFPEASQGGSLACTKWKYEKRIFGFQDLEDGRKYALDEAKLIHAFDLMYSREWPKGCARRVGKTVYKLPK